MYFTIVFLYVFVANAVFYNVLNAFLLNSCSGGPRRLWMSGSALAELCEAPVSYTHLTLPTNREV